MKLVREHINESFKEDSDPISDMGIGFDSLFKITFLPNGGYYSIDSKKFSCLYYTYSPKYGIINCSINFK